MSVQSRVGTGVARVTSLALLMPSLGLRRGREYRRLVREQSPDREETVYEFIWRDAAETLGVDLTSEGGGSFRIGDGQRAVAVWKLNTPIDGPEVRASSLDKPAVAARLGELGIPRPVGIEFQAYEVRRAARFLAASDGPCVVKPAAGASGHGVTCAVETRTDLLRAVAAAAAFGSRLVIERQAAGDVYRLLFLDGVLLDVVRRRPPGVVGDGSSTVIQLITAENRRRIARRGFGGLTLIRPDLDCILALRRVGLRLSAVPPAGTRIDVKTSNADGGDLDTETVHERPSDALVAEAAAACAAVGARLAGVDLATPDLGRDNRSAGGTVIEVNVPPGLQFHYLVADPARATHVAVPVLRTLLDYD